MKDNGLRTPKWAKGPLFRLWLLWVRHTRDRYIARVMSMRPLGVWMCLGKTFNGAKVKHYIDGEFIEEKPRR